MKVLILSSSFPYPIDVGRKSVMSGFVEFLCSRYGAENVVYATSDVGFDPSLAPCRVVALPQAHIARRAIEIAVTSLVRRQRPIQEAILYGSRPAVA
jgi:hypothetical protein